jgi:hypothetical protein
MDLLGAKRTFFFSWYLFIYLNCCICKGFTMYEIYHTWIHPSPIPSPLSNRYHFYIYMYIICTVFILLPLSSLPPPPTGVKLPSLWEETVLPPVLWFYRRKNIKDKKRNMTFLLVWNKDSYTGSFLVLFQCIYVLQPQLVHLLFTYTSRYNWSEESL